MDRLTELAYAAWLNAQLHDDDVAELQGLPEAATRAGHLHAILDGYGLPSARRGELVDRMVEVAVHGARDEAVRARSASWMLRHRRLLLG